MREGDDGIYAPYSGRQFCLEAAHDLLADAVHATDRGNDPYLVADTYLPVRTTEAFKGCCGRNATSRPFSRTGLRSSREAVALSCRSNNLGNRFVLVFQQTGQIRLYA